jgi:AraC-like DNA-binding protein
MIKPPWLDLAAEMIGSAVPAIYPPRAGDVQVALNSRRPMPGLSRLPQWCFVPQRHACGFAMNFSPCCSPGLGARRVQVVDTRDPDVAREAVARVFCPHRLVPLAGTHAFHARHYSTAQADFSINTVAYGSRVEIDPGYLGRFFLLQMPERGHASVTCGSRTVEAGPRRASLLSPTLPTRMIWEPGCEKIIILIGRQSLERHLAHALDEPVDTIEFDPDVDLDGVAGSAIAAQVRLLAQLSEGAPIPGAVLKELASALQSTLLATLAHSRQGRLQKQAGSIAPAHVRRAEEYIRHHLDDALPLPDLAAVAGCSVRSLQDGFRRFRGMTVTAFILEQRLQRWRDLLTRAEGRGRATDLALMAGLTHFGRAAASYRERFGELPSQTLRSCSRT